MNKLGALGASLIHFGQPKSENRMPAWRTTKDLDIFLALLLLVILCSCWAITLCISLQKGTPSFENVTPNYITYINSIWNGRAGSVNTKYHSLACNYMCATMCFVEVQLGTATLPVPAWQ